MDRKRHVDGVKHRRTDSLDSFLIQDIKHFGRPLKDHLIGTHDLLERWGCSEAVCLAGLFHSVYGTKTFKTISVTTQYRPRLRELIGEYAESLVYIFCMSDRKKLLMENRSEPFFWINHSSKERSALSREILCDLLELEAANYVEQLPFGTVQSAVVFNDMRTRFEVARPLMSAKASEAVMRAIDDHEHFFKAVKSLSP